MSYIVLYANGEKFTPTIKQVLVGTTDGTNQSWLEDDVWTREEDNKGRYYLNPDCQEVQRLAEHIGISAINRPSIVIEKEIRKLLCFSNEVFIYYFCTYTDHVEFKCDLFYLEQ